MIAYHVVVIVLSIYVLGGGLLAWLTLTLIDWILNHAG